MKGYRIRSVLIMMFFTVSVIFVWCGCTNSNRTEKTEFENGVPTFQTLTKLADRYKEYTDVTESLRGFSRTDLRSVWGMPDENMKINHELPLDRWFYKKYSIEAAYNDDETVLEAVIYVTEEGATIW